MSEVIDEHTEVPVNVAISHLFSGWLRAEVVSSFDDNNAVLNDFAAYQASINMQYDDPNNTRSQKSLSHYDRLERWTGLFSDDITSKEAAKYQLFGVLMSLSGAHREQCFTVARTADEYMSRRYGSNPHGLYVSEQVDQRLSKYFGSPEAVDLTKPTIEPEQLVADTLAVNQQRFDVNLEHNQGKRLFGMRRAIYGAHLLLLRRAWLDIGVDYVLHAATLADGDLAAVPVFEPNSITFAQTVYPFAELPAYFTDSK